jgi:hypothetical protein
MTASEPKIGDILMPRIGGLYTLKTTRAVHPVTPRHIWRNKKPMSYCVGDALKGNGYNAEDFFCLLDYERDESTGLQYLNILSTNGITGYILCYDSEKLVEVET